MTKKKPKTSQTLVLLDAHAIIHRAYHALPDFVSGEGEPTGALYGLSAMLLKIIADLKPDYIVAAYDLPGPTERHKAFDEYKAGREKADEALVHQIERSRDIFKAFNIPVYEKPGFEADDIIGTIVSLVKNRKTLDVVIASGDMDTLQLVSGTRVRVYTLRKGIKDTIVYDEKGVVERFGFAPKLLPDFKGLRGDPSDNIPGIPGVGEKTATELVTEFGSIGTIYKELKRDEHTFLKKGVKARIVGLLKDHQEEAEFSKMLAEIRHDAPINFRLPEHSWKESFDTSSVLKLFRELSFRTLAERVQRTFGDAKKGESQKAANEKPTTKDGVTEEQHGEIPSENDLKETGLALWVLNSENTNPGLDDILRFAGTGSFAKAQAYIFEELAKQNLEKIYRGIELPLVPIIEGMEKRGVKVDVAYLKKLSKKYHTELTKIEKRIYRHAKKEFNINSPRQLGGILFDELGLKNKAKTASGQRSTRESELQKLTGEHPIIDDILAYRELQKLLSTYINNLPHLVSPSDGRLHATFLQAGTTTGRMSSQNPNLQNIPIRTELGKVIRNAFVAEKGHKLLALDYSQIELRAAAFLSGDPKMAALFKEGGDIHAAVAQEVFGTTNPTARRRAKIINFGMLYGMGVNALARAIEAPRRDAQKFLDAYRKEFRTLIAYLENTRAFATKNGYTETFFGRRRYFPTITSHLPYVRAEALRMAANAPIQGTATADIIKIAMRRVDDWITKEKLGDKMFLVLQVHDELVYEVTEKLVFDVAPEIKNIMENVLSLKDTRGIPLVVDVSVGDNWGETQKML